MVLSVAVSIFLYDEERVWVLLQEHEVYSHYHAHEGGEVVPVQGFATETGNGVDGEYQQGYDLLDDLQLEQREGTAVSLKAVVVGRNHETILHKCQCPRNEDDDIEGRVTVQDVHVLQFQVSVPCKCHKDVGHDE